MNHSRQIVACHRLRLTTILVALALGVSSAAAQERTVAKLDGSTMTPAQIDATVAKLLEAAHVTGAGIGLFHDGKIAYLKAYGMRDREKAMPLTPDSVMTAASLSKAAFAAVVMELVKEGALDLDKPIGQYLPKPLPEYLAYADLNGDDRYKKLTLRILLSHTAGFANWRAFEPTRKLSIHFEPGSRYAYSGEGILLAQLVVEAATGKPLAELIQEKLYGPLRMTRTSMVWEPRFESDFANGYDEYERSLGPERRTKANAAGSMQTTLRDYATFLSALMRGRVLDSEMTATMLKRQVNIHSAHQFPSLAEETTAANDGIQLGYGLGWGVYVSKFGEAFFKEGHDEGWRHLALCFRNGSGILIMTNSSNGEGVFRPLIESLLGQTEFPFDWENYTPYNLLPPLPKLKEHKKASLSQDQLDRLAGKYALSADLVMTVTAGSGRLFVQENDEPKQEYLPESTTDFYSTNSTDECSFRVGPDGSGQALILHVDGKDVELKQVK